MCEEYTLVEIVSPTHQELQEAHMSSSRANALDESNAETTGDSDGFDFEPLWDLARPSSPTPESFCTLLS